MSAGRQLGLWEQRELHPAGDRPLRIVVSRSAPTGAEVFLVRAGQGWSLPEGTCRLAETPHEASERFLHERWGSGLATAAVDGGATLFAAEADAADSGCSSRSRRAGSGSAWGSSGRSG